MFTMNFAWLMFLCLGTIPVEGLSNGGAPTAACSRRDAVLAGFTTTTAAWLLCSSNHLNSNVAWADLSEGDYVDGPEGLKYRVLAPGTSGIQPQRGQKVQTSYTLWINGFPDESSEKKAIQIDSSRKPVLGDQPFKVRAGVKQVIRGWDLMLMSMQEGEVRRLIVPPSLGYGDKGIGPIPGGATLYFEMKLTKVEQPMEELTPEAKKWMEQNPL